MIGAASVASVLIGSVLAVGANWRPSHVEVLETTAGAFLIFGFGLLGSALQQFA